MKLKKQTSTVTVANIKIVSEKKLQTESATSLIVDGKSKLTFLFFGIYKSLVTRLLLDYY